MSEKKISYLNRTFDDYKQSLIDLTKKYYPNLDVNYDDASIMSWLSDMIASVSDNLSYNIDRALQETQVSSAQEKSSLYALARSNGLRIPGPKAAMCEVEFSCELPASALSDNQSNSVSTVSVPNWAFAPKIKRGTLVGGGGQVFEVLEDVDFAEQFDSNGNSNRTIIPKRDSNGNIKNYRITKLVTVCGGQSKIYQSVLSSNTITPFMEVIIPDTNVMNVESIIFKVGTDYNSDPSMNEFSYEKEYVSANESITNNETYRFFEVESLIDQYRWGPETSDETGEIVAKPVVYGYNYVSEDNTEVNAPVASITKGEWKPLRQKYITEFTDNGYLKIIFGGGTLPSQGISTNGAMDFSRNQISRMVNNDALGVLPPAGTTMFVLYRTGGGESSNVPKGAINTIISLRAEIGSCISSNAEQQMVTSIKNSIKVTNTIPSVGGKNAPSEDEIRYMIKYNNAAQNRCITVKDYENRVMMMPPKYGCPFRVSSLEENNKIMLYLLGIDNNGKLSDLLPGQLVSNIVNYLSLYRTINDFIEIKSGRIINISVECDLYVNKNYNKSDVVLNVINTIKGYMDINKHQMGEDIFIGDLQKSISLIDGVINVIGLRVYNETGNGYSSTETTQEKYYPSVCEYSSEYGGEEDKDSSEEADRFRIDLDASDGILYSNSDTMYEIKYPEKDIKIKVKSR